MLFGTQVVSDALAKAVAEKNHMTWNSATRDLMIQQIQKSLVIILPQKRFHVKRHSRSA